MFVTWQTWCLEWFITLQITMTWIDCCLILDLNSSLLLCSTWQTFRVSMLDSHVMFTTAARRCQMLMHMYLLLQTTYKVVFYRRIVSSVSLSSPHKLNTVSVKVLGFVCTLNNKPQIYMEIAVTSQIFICVCVCFIILCVCLVSAQTEFCLKITPGCSLRSRKSQVELTSWDNTGKRPNTAEHTPRNPTQCDPVMWIEPGIQSLACRPRLLGGLKDPAKRDSVSLFAIARCLKVTTG